jgi:EAL domain-containing protein (putative c-di-GMP-specific phosphodiesterase class I)/DNA-binding response OmpR family regulator
MQAREPFSQRPRLRAAHVTQIPLRAGDLRQRGKRLCQGGWDINVALQLAEDAEALASTCHLLGDRDTATRLESFAESIWVLLDPPVYPDEQMLAELTTRLDVIDTGRSDPIEPARGHEERPSTLFGYAAAEDNGFPLLVRPPSRYWQRFASLPAPERLSPIRVAKVAAPVEELIEEAAPMTEPVEEVVAPAERAEETAAAPTAEVQDAREVPMVAIPPTLEASNAIAAATLAEADAAMDADVAADPSERKACHLHDGADMALAIDLQLGMLGYELVHVDGLEALKEWLSRSTPSLIMLAGEYQHAIEEIGALVQSARTRSGQRILLIAHGAGKSDLATRLRALRAGCDAYIAQPDSADAVIARLRQLDVSTQADPFRVMIVEDDRSQAFFAESILRKNGMQTLAVDDAADVLDKLDEFAPDLILMDLNMPVCNGIELTALIREREAYISTPIVFLSGEGDTEKQFEALSAGGDDFLSKPIAPRHLITAVTSRVRRARLVARHRPATARREPGSNVQTATQLSARLTEMLAMEDAATRNGGVLFIALECVDELRKRLGQDGFFTLVENLISVLRSQLGRHDLLARSGDGEFILLNPDRSRSALDQLAIQLRAAVEAESFGTPDKTPDIAVAVGICPFTRAVGDAGAMIEAAELAMLDTPAENAPAGVMRAEPVAATRAANAPVFAAAAAVSPSPIAAVASIARSAAVPAPATPVAVAAVSTAPIAAPAPVAAQPIADPIVGAIRKALEDSTFRIVFQPIVSLHGEEEKQFQALLRLSTDSGRVYSATELVPAAETAGLIGDVDRWVLESCLDTIANHLRGGDSVRLFVNQSVASVNDPDRVEWMRQALESRRVPAAQISLDLRMEDASADLAGYIGFALSMKQLGVTLTLSGVEAGDKCIDLLMHLPVDFVKLSPRYTSDRGGDLVKELTDLVKISHASGRKVIAPRVEEARVAASLWACGIDLIQGNFVQEATRDTSYDFQVANA